MNDATNKQHDRQTAPRGRSPSYPGIDLATALQRARTLYEREQHHAAPTHTIVRHWGYVADSGPGLVTLAALKKFGLLLDEGKGGKRMARLSPLALRIIKDRREPSPERTDAIREAAFLPKIHQELWDRYGGLLPSDDNLMFELETNQRFTESGARELISQFRRTLGFLDGLDGDKIASEDREQDEPKDDEGAKRPGSKVNPKHMHAPLRQTSTPNLPGNMKELMLPVGHGAWATLRGEFPMSEAAWSQMMKVLDAMKPGLMDTTLGGAAVRSAEVESADDADDGKR